MDNITKNLKTCFDISKYRSMRQFCKVIDIDQANLNKKMSESNTKYSFTKKDIQKICYNLGIRKEWLVNSEGEMFDKNADVKPTEWVFGEDKTPNINMVNTSNAHHNQQIVGDNISEVKLLREQIEDLRQQLASKDAQINQLLDMLAKK